MCSGKPREYLWESRLTSKPVMWPPCYYDHFFNLRKKALIVSHCGMLITALIGPQRVYGLKMEHCQHGSTHCVIFEKRWSILATRKSSKHFYFKTSLYASPSCPIIWAPCNYNHFIAWRKGFDCGVLRTSLIPAQLYGLKMECY